MMLGYTTHPCGGSWGYDYLGEYSRFDNYEVAYNHYLNREGATDLSAPLSNWSVVVPVGNSIAEDRGRQVVREASFPITGD